MEILHDNKTPQGRAATMKTLLDNIENVLCNLYARWQDEKEYEDIKDYKNVLQPEIEKCCPGATIVSFTKKFDIKLNVPDFPYQPIIRVRNTNIAWSSK